MLGEKYSDFNLFNKHCEHERTEEPMGQSVCFSGGSNNIDRAQIPQKGHVLGIDCITSSLVIVVLHRCV